MAKKPEDYVIVLSDLIQNQFNVLGYQTDRNQIGEIYFMKYEGSQTSTKDRGLSPPGHQTTRSNSNNSNSNDIYARKTSKVNIEQQRQTAQIIAFYFVRLFQILGALLIVIKDINLPIDQSEPEKGYYSGRPIINQTGIPRFDYSKTSGPSASQKIIRQPIPTTLTAPAAGGGQTGGYAPDELILGPFEFLRSHISSFNPDKSSLPANIASSFKEQMLISAINKQGTYYKITSALYFQYVQPDSTQNIGSYSKYGKFKLIVKDDTTYKLEDIPIFIKNVYPDDYSFDSPARNPNSKSIQTIEFW